MNLVQGFSKVLKIHVGLLSRVKGFTKSNYRAPGTSNRFQYFSMGRLLGRGRRPQSRPVYMRCCKSIIGGQERFSEIMFAILDCSIRCYTTATNGEVFFLKVDAEPQKSIPTMSRVQSREQSHQSNGICDDRECIIPL